MVCPGHNRGIVELQYSAVNEDGVFMVSACLDGKPMLRDGASGDWVGTFEGHKGAVWSACINRDATLVATGAAEFSARLWDAVTGDCRHVFSMKHICKSVALANDSQRLLAGGNMPSLSLFDLNAPEATPALFPYSSRHATKIAQFIDGSSDLFMSAGSSEMLHLWDARLAPEKAEVRTLRLSGTVKSGEMSRDGRFLTLVTSNEELECWDMVALEKIRSFALPAATESASVHRECGRWVCGGQDLTVRVFDYASGQMLESHRGHHGPVWVLRFAPDGRTFSSGSDDGTIRIWQTSPTPNTVIESAIVFE
uniref:Serine-threonine kinase receptor-associated protein n=1 Tax=Erythrolobus australicus TaxID=1077150 RepID=A0A7S1XI18_9RHOD